MKAIFVESANGYLARSDNDDMSWTPMLDKQVFKLLTYVYGGVCVCSKKTYSLLPPQMFNDTGRKFIVAERNGANSLINLNKSFPNAVLIGGPTFLTQAYKHNIIDTFIVTTLPRTFIHSSDKFKNPFSEILTKPQNTVKFQGMVINIYLQKTLS